MGSPLQLAPCNPLPICLFAHSHILVIFGYRFKSNLSWFFALFCHSKKENAKSQ